MSVYIEEIKENSIDSHQKSPGYVLTFLRWSNRDTFNYSDDDALDTRRPLVVYNDAIQVSTGNSKNSMTSSMTAVLKGGDINYSTAIHSSDFVIVNMLDWEDDAERVRNKAVNLEPINKVEDGFKGVYKVKDVVKEINVDPGSGVKTVTYSITAAGFTEFNNVIYYNPAIVAAFSQQGTFLWQSEISKFFANKLKSNNDIDTILRTLFKMLIGQPPKAQVKKEVPDYGNTHFQVPQMLGNLLGRRNALYVSNIYNFVIGVWKNRGNSSDLASGMNPSISKVFGDSNFFETGEKLKGNKQVSLQNFNSNTAWSILNGFLNDTINEMYTTYRISPDGDVQPTVVARQKPFTNEHFFFQDGALSQPVTKFLSLPRWKISTGLLKKLKTSKSDALRFNFVQVYTRSLPEPSVSEQDLAQQISSKNFVSDDDDISRNGLRPYIKTANFDFPGTNKPTKRLRAKEWSQMVADWILNGHLKESGTLSFEGIQAPVSVGDNIELDNIVYHIESISHICGVRPNGKKYFTTNMQVSYGIDLRSSFLGPVYSEMDHTLYNKKQEEDFKNEKIMPAVSEAQDIANRSDGEKTSEGKQESFTDDILRRNR